MMSYILFLFFNMFRICCLFMIPTTHWTDVLRDFSPTILSSLSCAATDDLETNILWIAFGSLFPKCRTLCLLTLKLICHFFTQKYRLGTFLPALHWLRISPFQKKKISISTIYKIYWCYAMGTNVFKEINPGPTLGALSLHFINLL